MQLNHYFYNQYLVIGLEGEFDANAVQGLRQSLQELVDKHEGSVAFNLSKVTLLDSSGIGAMVFLFKKQTLKQKKLVLVAPQNQPYRLIKLLRIDKTIETVSSLEALIELTGTL